MVASILPHPVATDQAATDLCYFVQRFAQAGRMQYNVPIDPGTDGQNALHHILCEIDETVLPRRITVVCQPGGDIALTVSNRRLLSIEPCNTPQEQGPKTPEDMAQRFGLALQSAMAGAENVRIRKPEPLGDHQQSDLSVSATLLRTALDVERASGAPGAQAEDAASALRLAASSWVEATLDLIFPVQRGPEDEVASLKAFWQNYAAKAAGMTRQDRIETRAEHLIFIPLHGDTGLALFTQDKAHWVLAMLPKARFERLCAACPPRKDQTCPPPVY